MAATSEPKHICIIGSGSWGSALALIVGKNVTENPNQFASEVNLWVFEETVDGQKLSNIINTQHENVKYLPGRRLPENVIAVPDIQAAASQADILIFAIPHQFLARSLAPLKGNLKPGAIGVSLIKGFEVNPNGGVQLISEYIHNLLDINVSVLMGANLAHEVADGEFCETTIGLNAGTEGQETGWLLKQLFQSPNFRVTVIQDAQSVEMCGALKNIVACGVGFADGLGCGNNTKAAVIRIGLMEMIRYVRLLYPSTTRQETFLESCGVADLITTCYGGRNQQVAEAFVKTGKSLDELEKELLNGQKLQGPQTAAEVNHVLKELNVQDNFPLFSTVHKICVGDAKPEALIDALRNHPGYNRQISYHSKSDPAPDHI